MTRSVSVPPTLLAQLPPLLSQLTATARPTPTLTPTPSLTPLPTGSVSPSPTEAPVVSLEGVANALKDACGNQPGFLCRTVYDATHSNYLASGAEVFLGTPIKILFILLIAMMVRTVLHRGIKRTTRRAAAGGGRSSVFRGARAGTLLGAFGDPAVLLERRRQRAETVGSLLRSGTSIVIFGLAFITMLGELGINLAPIVASAGVLGIAAGFGAQNLVRDFLSGMFMLLEDQYGVGDVIDVGPVSGAVEAVSLRTTRLRDVEGTVWYVRNGEIARVGNKSQQWARTVLDIPLDYDTEVSDARRALLDAAVRMWQDPAWASVILAEPEVWGIEAMTSDGYTIRVVVKTQPLKQWDVARELRERIRAALTAEGIDIGAVPRSEVIVVDDEETEGRQSDSDEGDEDAAGGAGGAGTPAGFGERDGAGGDSGPPELEPPAPSPVGRTSGPSTGAGGGGAGAGSGGGGAGGGGGR
jgi:moderate conductance mechanosensitive channel